MKFPPAFAVRPQRLLFFVGFCSVLACSPPAYAAHPLITDDAGTQGTGKMQLELNGEYGHDKEDGVTTKTTQGNATFTYGLNESVDLVVGVPYLHVRTSDEATTTTDNGISDTALQVKWRLYEHDDLSLALKPGITLPTGDEDKGLGTGKATYSLFFIASKEMNPWAFHLNLGYIRNENTQDEEKNIWHASIASTFALTENLKAVANLGIESNREKLTGNDPAFLLGGLIYSLSEKLDLDCGLKYGLTDSETDYTLLAGVTWKF